MTSVAFLGAVAGFNLESKRRSWLF